MKFKGIHPQTGQTLWGCPLRTGGPLGKVLIQWFDPNGWGSPEGETDPTPEELAWISSNANAVCEMRRKCEAWREKVDDIPF